MVIDNFRFIVTRSVCVVYSILSKNLANGVNIDKGNWQYVESILRPQGIKHAPESSI